MHIKIHDEAISELHGMLKTAKKNIKNSTKDVLMVNKGKGMNYKGFQKPKPKLKPKYKVESQAKPPKEGICFFCNEPGHWKRNCKLYLDDLKKNKGSVTISSSTHVIEINLSHSDSWILDTGSKSHICIIASISYV